MLFKLEAEPMIRHGLWRLADQHLAMTRRRDRHACSSLMAPYLNLGARVKGEVPECSRVG